MNQKREVFFTKTYSQGMKVIALGKSNRPRVPRPVEMINLIKIYSREESETNLMGVLKYYVSKFSQIWDPPPLRQHFQLKHDLPP